MIIRILGMGQFRLDDTLLDQLNKIDNRIVDHVNKGNKDAFQKDLDRLISGGKGAGLSHLYISQPSLTGLDL